MVERLELVIFRPTVPILEGVEAIDPAVRTLLAASADCRRRTFLL